MKTETNVYSVFGDDAISGSYSIEINEESISNYEEALELANECMLNGYDDVTIVTYTKNASGKYLAIKNDYISENNQ